MEKEKEENQFKAKNWEPVISTEEGEKGCCEACRGLVEAKKVGEHLYCPKCKKYIWRKKCQKNTTLN